ncbi:hypothetical protein B2H94_08925 [Clostridium sporogenes]|uniref:Uncharacterized protein n=1 Tax=Clostridium sporogenes TaxID=1509 RepID=A0ABD6RS24_CLOSG|nr:hypothetical protein [Clostridium sporogenes]OSB19205.1 hypothetical protein B2H94_08925 [Clostridium sporogenes]
MIKINDYCSIAFAKWVRNRQCFINLNTLDNHQINELVEAYLKENARRWNFRFFLKLFQDYTIRYDSIITEPDDLIFIFRNFCMNVKSLEFIDANSVDKRVYLYPLLQKFCDYVNIRTSKYIDNELKHIAAVSYENREGLLEWFNKVTKTYSEELLHLFSDYMENLFNYDLEMFSLWLYKNKRKEAYFKPTNYHILSFDNRKYHIIEEINNGIVNDNIKHIIENSEKRVDFNAYISLTKEYTQLDFVHYLEKRNINIFKQVPKEILESLVDEYINEFPDANERVIYSFVGKIGNNKTFINKLKNMFRNKYGNEFSFERYISCKYHGVFLFRKNDNLSKFLRNFWHDIHHGTGETLDFYFTDRDINTDYHCKQWIKRYINMEIDVKEFPAIFLWEINSSNKGHILLKGLSHGEIFDVIEYLTAQLEVTGLSESILATNIKIKQTIDSKKLNYNTYIAQNSQIAAFGENAVSNNNTFDKQGGI